MQRSLALGRRRRRFPMPLESLCGLVLFAAAEADATTFVPMSIADLTRGSTAVVIGTVEAVESFESADGALRRHVRIAVESAATGEVPEQPLVLEEMGGRVGERRELVFGAPSYSAGERVLVFVDAGRGGVLRTNQLALGKFRIEDGVALRDLGPGTAVAVSAATPAWRAAIPLDELLAEIAAASGSPPVTAPATEQRAAPSSALADAEFNLFATPGRFFEVDEGAAISFLVDQRGDAILGFAAARRAVDDAFAAWTAVDAARIALADVGLVADLDRPCTPGLNKIRFDDPDDEIPDPVNCTGVLGVGGFCSIDSELKRFDGVTFQKSVRALVTFADHWDGCAGWTECNVAEVATHEIGHAIGFGHSSENPDETARDLSEATMYFLSHFDGRCAAVERDDVAAVTFVYPLDAPPTITTASPLPVAVFDVPYAQALSATGGSGAFTWRVGPPCQGVPGLELTAEGVIQGTPTVIGNGCFTVTATDANGDSHTKRFDIELSREPPTPTNTSIASTPTPTPTRTPTATFAPVEVCAGDCDGDRSVTLDELIRSVRIALGLDEIGPCSEIDRDGNSSITIDELVAAVVAATAGCTAA